ncbi:MAG TPA: hydroxymethylglutaryl-CoA lyase [Chitinophagaceae bacterium]|nr:hydroxymethylglutaryl-CoA lyase [Chitinophagaceae bacterium]
MTNIVDNYCKIIECPRDAMQGWPHPIPAELKIAYLRSLLQVGFYCLDCGSFVSPKAIPQMADTAQVLKAISKEVTDTKLLVIVANERGALEAANFEAVSFVGFPFSVSETFQQRNTNSSIEDSRKRVEKILDICAKSGKELVVYLSMAFGNPYGDPWSEDIVYSWAQQLSSMGVTTISLADTVGVASPAQVQSMTSRLIAQLPQCEIGVHLHSAPKGWKEKASAAWEAGCRRFDSALKGIGGCPMAKDELVGNLNTEWLVEWLAEKKLPATINQDALKEAASLASRIFV